MTDFTPPQSLSKPCSSVQPPVPTPDVLTLGEYIWIDPLDKPTMIAGAEAEMTSPDRVCWVNTVPAGTSAEEVLSPTFWAMLTL